jgi:hypothetical protein
LGQVLDLDRRELARRDVETVASRLEFAGTGQGFHANERGQIAGDREPGTTGASGVEIATGAGDALIKLHSDASAPMLQ